MAQRGSFSIIERQMAAAVELFPVFARAHLLRSWAGVVDVTPDASPIVGRTPLRQRRPSTAAGAPAASRRPRAWAGASPTTIAHGEPHPLVAPFGLDRFTTGALVDEHGAAAVAH